MKFLVVLALVLAASNAAFTGSLVKQTQPLLDRVKAELSTQIRSRSSADVALKSAFTGAIQDHVGGVVAQLESMFAGLQATGVHLAGQIQSVVAQIEAVTQNLSGGAQEIAASLIASIQSLLGGLFNGQSRISREVIKAEIQALISSVSLQNTIRVAVVSVFGDKLGEQVLFALAQSDRGFWGNIWGQIQGGIQGVVVDITQGVSGVASQISGLANQISNIATQSWGSVAAQFDAIKNVLTNFESQGWDNIQNIGADAAQELLNQIAPYYPQLGLAGAIAVSTILASYTGLTIPPSMIVLAGGEIISLIP